MDVLNVNWLCAERLRLAREEKGISQNEAGKRALVSAATVRSYEEELTSPNIKNLAALSRVYGRPVAWFVGG